VFCGYDGKPVENFNKTFSSILSRLKLSDDRWGKRRTVYSLRHFYCTQCLLSGIPVHIIAKNMGTSISYIEKHYSHVLTVVQAKELRTKKFKAKAWPRVRHRQVRASDDALVFRHEDGGFKAPPVEAARLGGQAHLWSVTPRYWRGPRFANSWRGERPHTARGIRILQVGPHDTRHSRIVLKTVACHGYPLGGRLLADSPSHSRS
jgi:hypothetical protein